MEQPPKSSYSSVSGFFVGTPVESPLVFYAQKDETISIPTTCSLSYVFIPSETPDPAKPSPSEVTACSYCTHEYVSFPHAHYLTYPAFEKTDTVCASLKPGCFVGTPENSSYICYVTGEQLVTLPSVCSLCYQFIPDPDDYTGYSNDKIPQPHHSEELENPSSSLFMEFTWKDITPPVKKKRDHTANYQSYTNTDFLKALQLSESRIEQKRHSERKRKAQQQTSKEKMQISNLIDIE